MIHGIRLDMARVRQLDQGIITALLCYDRDYQTGDVVNFHDQDGKRVSWSPGRKITHVLKNTTGLAAGYVVLSFNDPTFDSIRDDRNAARAEVLSLTRSNNSLRGQITKLRNRIDPQS